MVEHQSRAKERGSVATTATPSDLACIQGSHGIFGAIDTGYPSMLTPCYGIAKEAVKGWLHCQTIIELARSNIVSPAKTDTAY